MNGLNFGPMDLQKHSYSRKGQEVAKHLRVQIRSGELAVGNKFPPERELASILHVSRHAVRDALGLLESENYVITKRGAGGGSFVSEPSATAAVWIELMKGNVAELEEVLDFRMAIESKIAMLAAERRTEIDLVAMREAIESLPLQSPDKSEFREADGRFHGAMARAAGNKHLESAFRSARAHLFVPTDNIPYSETIEVTRRQHLQIFTAVKQQSQRAAERAVVLHIEETRRHLHSILDGDA